MLADSEGPDKTARMRSLIWDFAVCIYAKTRFRMARPNWYREISFGDNKQWLHVKNNI